MNENPFRYNSESQIVGRSLIVSAIDRIKKVSSDDGAINPLDFKNYDRRMIDRDLRVVADLERKFALQRQTEREGEDEKLARVLEYILDEQIELNDWFGSDASTRKVAKYDDYVNGVDTIVEFRRDDGQSHLALAIDVTYGSPDKKFQRIKKEIDEGSLGRVKYFESSDGTFQGSLTNVPRVVVGTDREGTLDLTRVWMARDQRALLNHPIRAQLLDEILYQQNTFILYARKKGQGQLVEILERSRSLMLKARRALPEGVESRRDRVYNSIFMGLDIFTR